jgi:hypothetical protein
MGSDTYDLILAGTGLGRREPADGGEEEQRRGRHLRLRRRWQPGESHVNGVTTAYVGDGFEWTGSTSTMVKYYSAGGQRVAMRVGWERRAPARPPSGSTAPSAHSSRSGDYVKPPR